MPILPPPPSAIHPPPPRPVPHACDPREGTRGSGIIRCRKPGILAKTELRIPYQRPIRFLPETDYPRASRSFPRIAGSGNEIESSQDQMSLLGYICIFILVYYDRICIVEIQKMLKYYIKSRNKIAYHYHNV